MTIKHLSTICAALSLLFTGCSGEEDSPQSVSGQDVKDILAQMENMTPEELEKLGELSDDQLAQGNAGSLEEVNNAISSIKSETPDDPGSASSPDESRSEEDKLNPPSDESQASGDVTTDEDTATASSAPDPEILQKAQRASQIQSQGIQKAQSGDDSGYEDFKESAKLLREVIAADAKLAKQASNLLAMAFYNEACALSIEENVEDAIAALELSFEYGGMDLEHLQKDTDLVNVRADAGFAAKLEAWQAKAAEAAVEEAKTALAEGESFPFAFEFTSIQDGKTISLESLKGKVVIVDIWGTWCPPCRAEIPSFVKLQETYGDEGFQIVGLNYEGNGEPSQYEQKVKDFIAEFGINYPCLFGDEATRSQVPNFSGYPTTIFIDREGKVRLKVVGLHEYSFLESIVKELLKS